MKLQLRMATRRVLRRWIDVGKDPFAPVRTVGLTLPDVEAHVKYDGSPVLRLGGAFLAGLAAHESAEPDTLIVRMDFDQRELLLEEAPETYYVTDYYKHLPVVLARLACLDRDALHDLLSVSLRLTLPKAGKRHAKKAKARVLCG